MSTPYSTRLDLDAEVRRAVIELLQPALADAVDLFTQVKQAHWNGGGISFISLHELFDRIAEDWTTEVGDAGSADLFTEISRDIDKQLWLTEAHLRD